jgi:hypothetical protein
MTTPYEPHDAGVLYQERGCGRNWRLMVPGFWLPLATLVVVVVYGLTRDPEELILIAGVPLFYFAPMSMLYRNWSTAMCFDETGVRIGGIWRHIRKNHVPTVYHQNSRICSVPWSAVREVDLITDPMGLQHERVSGTTFSRQPGPKPGDRKCQIGRMNAPFQRAFVGIWVDPELATFPDLRPARVFDWIPIPLPIPTPAVFIPKRKPPIMPDNWEFWTVPTRRPELIAAILDQLQARATAPQPPPKVYD